MVDRGILLKLVDKLVKDGQYVEALTALERAREEEPKNPYVRAYEERLRVLIQTQQRLAASAASPIEDDVESQLAQQRERSEDQRRAAILSKIAAFLTHANTFLARGEFDRALEEIARAKVLDPSNADIQKLDEKIRNAKEDASRRGEEERQRLIREREREQEQRFREELTRLHKEQEQHRQAEEEAKHRAQQQKLQESLQRSRAHLKLGRLKEAQAELAFALILEPTNVDARTLEKEIQRAHDEALRAEVERRRKEEEQRKAEEERVRNEINKIVEAANSSAAHGRFAEALQTLTKAYTLDPLSDMVQKAETRIIAERETARKREEEQRKALEAEVQKKREEERRRREAEERDALIQARLKETESRKRADRDEIQRHLARAKEHLVGRHYEQALAEVALAFIIDPLSDDVKEFEAEVLNAQEAQPRSPVKPPPPPAPAPHQASDTHREIAKLLQKASDHAARKDFSNAFDLISHAYWIDPLDQAVHDSERKIQTAFIKHQRGDESGPPPPPKLSADPHASRETAASEEPAAAQKEGRQKGQGLAARLSGVVRLLKKRVKTRSAVAIGAVAVPLIGTGLYLVTTGGEANMVADSKQPLRNSKVRQSTNPQTDPGNGTQTTIPYPDAESARYDYTLPANIEPPGAKPQTQESVNSEAQWAAGEQSQQNGEKTTTQQSDTKVTDSAAGMETPAEATRSDPAPEGITVGSSGLGANPVASNPTKPTITPRAPEIRRIEQPVLPDALLREAIRGEVLVRVEIGPDGRPIRARVARSTDPRLDSYVIDAVMRSDFVPGVSEDGSTTTWMAIPFRFK